MKAMEDIMMKKLFVLFLFVIAMVSFSGCGKVIELTDEEYYMIAEYSADLLIKYDKDIKSKYNEAYMESLIVTDVSTEEITTTEVASNDTTEVTEVITEETTVSVTEATTEKNTEETTEDKKNDSPEPSSEDKEINKKEDTNTGTDLTPNVNKNFDIAEFAGLDTVSIKYAYYAILEQYPSYDKDGMYIEITAPEGYKLLVVKFDVENKTNDDQHIDMFSADLSYQIVINDQKSAKQMLTILTDDLYTYQADIGGSMRQETVLLFQVSDDIVENIQGIKLKVSKNNDTKIMQLQ